MNLTIGNIRFDEMPNGDIEVTTMVYATSHDPGAPKEDAKVRIPKEKRCDLAAFLVRTKLPAC